MVEGPLQGKVAIVTGAASPIGLGHAMTVALVRAGARVALLDINDTWLAESAAEMRTLGGADCALPIRTDITDPTAAEQAVHQTIAELGGLHTFLSTMLVLAHAPRDSSRHINPPTSGISPQPPGAGWWPSTSAAPFSCPGPWWVISWVRAGGASLA